MENRNGLVPETCLLGEYADCKRKCAGCGWDIDENFRRNYLREANGLSTNEKGLQYLKLPERIGVINNG